MFNCRLLRPAVIGLICHRARLAGRQEEAGARGVTPPIDDDHTGAPAKRAAGPVLLLWSFGILLLRSLFQGNNDTALILQQTAVWSRGIFPTWTHCSTVSLSLYLLATVLCWLCRIFVEINLAARGIILAGWWDISRYKCHTHSCSAAEMSQYKALQEHNWSDLLSLLSLSLSLSLRACLTQLALQ